LPDKLRLPRFVDDGRTELFGGALFAEGGSHVFLLYARRRVTALTEVLLFGTITQHPGMRHRNALFGVTRGSRFLDHFNAPLERAYPVDPTSLSIVKE
jgi:hypothetical protein